MLDTTLNRNTLIVLFRAFTRGGAVLALLLIGFTARGSEVKLLPQNAVSVSQQEFTPFERAQQIVIPEIRFDTILVSEAVEILGRLSKEYDALGEGINLLFNVTDVANEKARLSLHAVNMNVYQILQTIAKTTPFEAIKFGSIIWVSDDPRMPQVTVGFREIEGEVIEINGQRVSFDFGISSSANAVPSCRSFLHTGMVDIVVDGGSFKPPVRRLSMNLGNNKRTSEIKIGREMIVQGETVFIGTAMRSKMMRSGDKYLLIVEIELTDPDDSGGFTDRLIKNEAVMAIDQTLVLYGIQSQGEDGIRQKAFVVSIEEN